MKTFKEYIDEGSLRGERGTKPMKKSEEKKYAAVLKRHGYNYDYTSDKGTGFRHPSGAEVHVNHEYGWDHYTSQEHNAKDSRYGRTHEDLDRHLQGIHHSKY